MDESKGTDPKISGNLDMTMLVLEVRGKDWAPIKEADLQIPAKSMAPSTSLQENKFQSIKDIRQNLKTLKEKSKRSS